MSNQFKSSNLTALDREQAIGYGATIIGNDRIVLRGADITFGHDQVQVRFEGNVSTYRCLSDAVWYENI